MLLAATLGCVTCTQYCQVRSDQIRCLNRLSVAKQESIALIPSAFLFAISCRTDKVMES